MKTITITRNIYGDFIIQYGRVSWDSKRRCYTGKAIYSGFTRREAIRKFRDDFGLKGKHLEIIEV